MNALAVEVSEELDAYRAAVGLGEAVVGPGTTLAVDNLEAALGGGFRVSGAAFFWPGRPFDPSPTIPGPNADPSDAARQNIGGVRAGVYFP